ncbi:uncharacterized protein [Drosophila virilis]|uniref:Uncharacterized protein n=1 Tax=Drosophila virilis TaxID=7244 RepID=B4LLM1_DROVI|nr:uncharacterized protein LOC6626578 [Drosophila virilis]EDW60884.1 uncharacterized protein Dvir_GJ21735 [Drosophila virilis]
MPHQLYKSWKYTRFTMCLLRCFLSLSYLWIMLHAAAVVPVVNEHSKWFFWVQHLKFWITYASILTFDAQTQCYVVLVMLMVLFRLYQCSRCNFCNTRDNIRDGGKVPYNKRMLLYFGPYLLLFSFCWLASMYSIGLDLMRIILNDEIHTDCMYSKIGMAVFFKMLVLANVLVRCVRCGVILHLFADEPDDELRNVHNLGEHLNLFFLN